MITKKRIFLEVSTVHDWFMAGGLATPHLLWSAGKAITDGLENEWSGLGLKIVVIFYEEEGNKVRWCIDKDFVLEKGDELFANQEKVQELYERWKVHNDNVFKSFEKIKQSDNKLELYDELLAVYVKMFSLSTNLDYVIVWADEIIENLSKKYNLSKEETQIISSPDRLTFTQKEMLCASKLRKEMEYLHTDLFQEKVARHQEDFFWIQNNYKNTTPISIEEFLIEIKNIKNYDEIISRLEKYAVELQKQIKNISQKYNFSSEENQLIQYIGQMASWQDKRKEINVLCNHWLNSMLEEASKKTTVSFKELQFYHPHEFRLLIKEGKKFDVSKRMKKSVDIFLLQEEAITLVDKEYDLIEKKIFGEDNAHDKTSLKGIVAQTGIIQGKVRVVFDPSEKNFKEGEILVTLMTRPEFVHLMKKAAAIVTDEGGITSHAAIIARELQKPCIIGTKIATRVFKDGDLVEVDANTGIIKIIK